MASLPPFNCFICLSLGGWDAKMGRRLKEFNTLALGQGSRNGCPTCSMLAMAVERLQPDATFVRVYFHDELNGPLDVVLWSEISENSSCFEFHTIPGARSPIPELAGHLINRSIVRTALDVASYRCSGAGFSRLIISARNRPREHLAQTLPHKPHCMSE